MNKAQKYANSKNPQSTSEAKSLLRGYFKSKEQIREEIANECTLPKCECGGLDTIMAIFAREQEELVSDAQNFVLHATWLWEGDNLRTELVAGTFPDLRRKHDLTTQLPEEKEVCV